MIMVSQVAPNSLVYCFFMLLFKFYDKNTTFNISKTNGDNMIRSMALQKYTELPTQSFAERRVRFFKWFSFTLLMLPKSVSVSEN